MKTIKEISQEIAQHIAQAMAEGVTGTVRVEVVMNQGGIRDIFLDKRQKLSTP